MENVQTYLQKAVEQGASDLFIVAGKAVSVKREGEIVQIGRASCRERVCLYV